MSIVQNKKIFHDYFIEDRLEAGLVLKGWETKSIRSGRAQLKESYIIIRQGEVFLLGAHISPLNSASTHIKTDPTRTRKLLLHAEQIDKLIGKVERSGFTIVPINLHFKKGLIKIEIGLAKGKKQFDKRATIKEKEWKRQEQRLLREVTKTSK